MKCKSRLILVLFLGLILGFVISTAWQNRVLYESVRETGHKRGAPAIGSPRLTMKGGPDTPITHDDAGLQKMDDSSPITLYEIEKQQFVDKLAEPKLSPEKKTVQNDDIMTSETNTGRGNEYETRLHGRNVQNIGNSQRASQIHKLSDEIASRKPLLIAIVTSIQQLMSQTISIHSTWAKKAKNVVYFTGDVQQMPHLPHGMNIIQLEGIDDKQANWEIKEFAVVKYLTSHFIEDVDWFLIVGDDVFVNYEALRNKLEDFNAGFQVYMGRNIPDDRDKCNPATGVVYSRGLLTRLESYLPQCQGEHQSISQCIIHRGWHCTQAKEVQELFYLDQNQVVETSSLFSSDHLIHALTIQPVRYPKYMYRLYSFFLELNYNSSIEQTKTAADEIRITYPFIPTHLRSPFRFKQLQGPAKPDKATQPPATQQHSPTSSSNIFVRPRHVPKNKFEINFWEYFNQTRLMSVYNEQPSRGIIGGLREEARYALTKGIYIANQGLSPKNRLIFEKLENGYHRIDPMRGSEYILDFVFRKSSDRNVRVKKRIGLLRPYHETIVPVDSSNHLDHVNFVVTLSGLSNRLEQFLANFEKNILIPKEDASLTIVLFDGPEKNEVHQMISKYSSRYPASKMSILDVNGEFARGIGLHKGATHFNDNQLLFLVDVDLEISPEFLKRCRLNTIRNKQVYFPIFYKLYNLEFVNKYYRGNDTQFLSRRNGHWAHYSYGMVCIYASDYRRSGGYNIGIRGWGEEDVDLFNKVMSAGLEVFRSPDPGLIHLWHRKICNKDVILSTKAYLHCLHSKAENLADRTELAQYIFEQELKDGNVL